MFDYPHIFVWGWGSCFCRAHPPSFPPPPALLLLIISSHSLIIFIFSSSSYSHQLLPSFLPTQLNSTQLNSINSTQLNLTHHFNSTTSIAQLNSTQLISTLPFFLRWHGGSNRWYSVSKDQRIIHDGIAYQLGVISWVLRPKACKLCSHFFQP